MDENTTIEIRDSSQIKMLHLENDTAEIPTKIYIKGNKKLYGNEAISFAIKNSIKDLFGNFKLEVGKYTTNNSLRNAKLNGSIISVSEAFNSFMGNISNKFKSHLIENDKIEAHLIIAEPIPDPTHNNWSSYYRRYVRRHFDSLKIFYSNSKDDFKKLFTTVDFLPEPFAIFQYYKHVQKTYLYNKNKILTVLVVDIGGGTSDTCVIQTTKQGHISKSGKNSLPLGAHSHYAGGFKINEMILLKLYKKAKLGNYNEVKNKLKLIKKDDYILKNIEEINFSQNINSKILTLEKEKITINSMCNWDLTGDASNKKVPFSIHKDPFDLKSELIQIDLTISDYKEIVIEFWNNHLKSCIKQTIDKSKKTVSFENFDIVLMSGGTSNIGWFKELIKRDFQKFVEGNKVVEIENYKNVVSKGLAIECALRHPLKTKIINTKEYKSVDLENNLIPELNEESLVIEPNEVVHKNIKKNENSFESVVYNSIDLIFRNSNSITEKPRYKILNKGINIESNGFSLIKSANEIKDFINIPIQWKLNLSERPLHYLDYYVLNNSIDEHEINNSIDEHGFLKNESRLNWSDQRINTHYRFQKELILQLTIKNDSTGIIELIEPKSKYSVKSEPFLLDITTSFGDTLEKSFEDDDIKYIDEPTTEIEKTSEDLIEENINFSIEDSNQVFYGFDFGSSNSSVSYVSSNSLYQVNESYNLELPSIEDSHKFLPPSINFPIKKIIGKERSYKDDLARAALESYFITILFFCTMKEACNKSLTKNHLKNFDQLSIGPSLDFLNKFYKNDQFYSKYYSQDNRIKEVRDFINNTKHFNEEMKYEKVKEHVLFLHNVYLETFYPNFRIGVFLNVINQKRNTYAQVNILKEDPNNMMNKIEYKGQSKDVFEDHLFFLDTKNKKGIPLYPLCLFKMCDNHDNDYHMYLFNKKDREGSFIFISLGFPNCTVKITEENDEETFLSLNEFLYENDYDCDYIDFSNLDFKKQIT